MRMSRTPTMKYLLLLNYCYLQTEVLNSYGHPSEKHKVTTDDGYILSIYRIPNQNPSAIPILLMHGLSCSSTQFFMNRYNSPAFILADAGFDVWMGNFRGNNYTSHTKYSPQDSKYWDFTWQEMADHDMPYTIDYILNVTRHSKLICTGHSMGTIIGFAMFSTQPSYNHKVAAFFALSPIAFLHYAPVIELKYLPQILSLVPAFIAACRHGGSAKTYSHLAQIRAYKRMHKYDYGKMMNQKLYNSSMPPAYNLSEISVPVFIFYGANDAAADPLDVELLSRKLQNLKAKELFSWPLCDHSDFMIAKNMKELVYDNVYHTSHILLVHWIKLV
uniref:Partial AB-hydrolase lipase domain-containing protein n=1 Tax=Strigamia maritima TaxID=126957 RepID=T1JLA7_STRMM